MRSILNLPARRAWIGIAVVFVAGVVVGTALTLPSEAAVQVQERTFSSPAALVFNPIKPDRTADFEAVLAKLREALQNSDDPVRRQQLAGWKVLRATESLQGNIMYFFFISPTVPDANYTETIILNDAFPDEVQGLYEKLIGAYGAGQSFIDLEPVAGF